MKNIFHHSSAFLAKHKYHHHFIIGLIVVAVAGMGGVVLYKKFASAATFTFTQTSWSGGTSANTASHTATPSDQTGWTKYDSATGVTAASTVTLASSSYTATDDGAFSTSTTAGTGTSLATGGTFGLGTTGASTVTGTGAGASVGLDVVNGGSGDDGTLNLSLGNASGGCHQTGQPTVFTWSGSTCTINTNTKSTFNFTTINIPSGTTLSGSGIIPLALNASVSVVVDGTINIAPGTLGGGAGGDSGHTSGYGIGGGGTLSNFYGGGGGFGGGGGRSGGYGCVGAPAGGTYTGSAGSGGGGSGGGGGGGGLTIISNGQINISSSGRIYAYGAAGSDGKGGGSGGLIYLISPNSLVISSGSIISANGGNGGEHGSIGGGGGGGGRITLKYGTIDNLGSVSVVGGAGTTFAGGCWNGVPGGSGVIVSSSGIPYFPSGTFESATIDLGGKANLSTLDFASTIPAQSQTSCTASTGAGCALKFQVAANNDNSTWTYLGPDGTASTYFTSSAGSGEAIHSSLSGNRYIRYKAYLSTANTAYTPTLDSLTLNYTQYGTSGTLTSSKYDTGSADRVIGAVSWAPSDSNIQFQVRAASSAEGLDAASWCGATNCTGSYFTNAAGSSNATLGALTNDHQWFQYRVFLSGDGATTPTLTSASVSYVGNAPPVVSSVASAQISDPLDASNYGKVVITYDVADDDTSLGDVANRYKVTPTLYQYSTTGSAPWTDITTGLSANAYSVIALTGDGVVSHSPSVVWTPPVGIARTASAKIRVTVTDNEGANYSGVAAMATPFTLDTIAPTIVTAKLDSSGVSDVVTLTATDDSTLAYRLCNAACSAESWTSITSGTVTQIDWTATGAPNAETVYYQVRDLYGNVTANTITAPATPSGFLNADVSNPTADTFGESLSWVATPGFTTNWKYEVWSATTATAATQPSSYAHLATTTTNIYAHTITTATTSARWYKVRTINANGDISNFSALMTEGDVPDSFGTTLPDTAAPVISSLIATNIKNTSAEINFSTDELAIMQVFYGTASCGTSSVVPISPTPITTSYVTGHSVYLTDLTPNTTYYYCARVTDVLGNIGSITPGTVTTFTTIGGPVITNVTERELTDVSALIFWNTSTSSDSKVYYSTAKASVNASTPVTGAAVTVAGSDGAYQHQIGLTGLTAGSKYYYKVVSADAADAAISSTDDNNGQYYSFVTLKDTTPPTIMGTSTPVLASDAAVIVWQTDEMATTKVDYGTTPGVYTAKGVAEDANFSIYHVTTLSSATANVHGAAGDKNTLTPETTYYYKVTSKDAANNSATSEGSFTTPKTGDVTIVAVTVARPVNPVDTVTPDTTAPTISNVKVSDITPFSAVVSFETSESAYATLKYGKDASYGDAASDDVWGATHTIKLRGLTLGTDYHIKVTAHDKAGNTGTSDDQTFKTPFLSENLKDMTKIENIEQFQKEIEETIESILPSLVPPFVSKPVVSDITENGATVSFRTNIKAFPVVGFVEDGTYDTTKDNPYTGEVSDTENKTTEHTIALTGLKQNTKYHLQARAFSLPKVIGKSADITFTTKASKISGSIIERKKDSFTVVWTTDESTTSIVEYKNLKTRITERKTDDVKRTAHSMKIDNLPPGTTYEVDISGINEQGNIVEAGATLTVTTSRDVTAPIISGFKVDNALVPGRTDRIQTIVSWKTDEAANSTVYYEEGAGTAGDTKELANKSEVLDSYITAHSVILPNLKPGTIYRLKVTSSDDSGNEASFGPRTVITPRQTESITDIIFKNFEDSFKFLRDI